MSQPSQEVPSSIQPNQRWLSVAAAATYLGVSPQSIRNALHHGALRAAKLAPGHSNTYMIDRLDIDRLLERGKRVLPPYRKGTRPWVAKRWAAERRTAGRKKVRAA